MRRSTAKNSGIALVLVLWILSLMTLMAGSFALSTQRESAMLRHAHERSRALALGEGAIYYAMLMLSIPDQKLQWQADGRPYIWRGKDLPVEVRIQDEGGKIDINMAQEGTIKTVFRLMGLGEDQGNQLSDAILDWRDQDENKRPSGAEAPDYEARGLKAPPQNRQFLVMDELQGVLGMNPALYRKMQVWFTLYSMSDGLDPGKASLDVLTTLLGGNLPAAQGLIQQRTSGVPVSLPPVPGLNFTQSAAATYTVTAEVLIDEDQYFGISASIRRGATSTNLPFSILRWRPYHRPSRSSSEL